MRKRLAVAGEKAQQYAGIGALARHAPRMEPAGKTFAPGSADTDGMGSRVGALDWDGITRGDAVDDAVALNCVPLLPDWAAARAATATRPSRARDMPGLQSVVGFGAHAERGENERVTGMDPCVLRGRQAPPTIAGSADISCVAAGTRRGAAVPATRLEAHVGREPCVARRNSPNQELVSARRGREQINRDAWVRVRVVASCVSCSSWRRATKKPSVGALATTDISTGQPVRVHHATGAPPFNAMASRQGP